MATEEDSAIAECDEVTESLELLDAVLLQFDEEKQTPPPPEEAARIISSLVGSPYQSLQRGQGTQTTLPRTSKKLSSQFGSLPFDLSAHAAPSAPPWLSKETPRNHLHLPIQNPLTSRVGQSSEDEQFSDDSLEGQVWSSDRDLSSGRDDLVSRGEESVKGEKKAQSRSRSSIAWDIDWNEKKKEEKDKEGKGTYVIRDRKRRAGLDENLFNQSSITTSKSSDHLAKNVKISRGRSLPSLNTKKPLENGIIVPINMESKPDFSEHVDFHVEKNNFAPSDCTDNCEKIMDLCEPSSVQEKNASEVKSSVVEACNEHINCNGVANHDSADISHEGAIIETNGVNSESIIANCAIISTENQNGMLDEQILVNGDTLEQTVPEEILDSECVQQTIKVADIPQNESLEQENPPEKLQENHIQDEQQEETQEKEDLNDSQQVPEKLQDDPLEESVQDIIEKLPEELGETMKDDSQLEIVEEIQQEKLQENIQIETLQETVVKETLQDIVPEEKLASADFEEILPINLQDELLEAKHLESNVTEKLPEKPEEEQPEEKLKEADVNEKRTDKKVEKALLEMKCFEISIDEQVAENSQENIESAHVVMTFDAKEQEACANEVEILTDLAPPEMQDRLHNVSDSEITSVELKPDELETQHVTKEYITNNDVAIMACSTGDVKIDESETPAQEAQDKEMEPEQVPGAEEEIQAPPLAEILESGSDASEEESVEPLGPCEMSFKIMRPKVVRPNSMPAREENVVVYTTSVTLYPDAGLITYYDETKAPSPEEPKVPPNLLRPKSCSDISTSAAFACVDISLDDEPLSLEPLTVTATEEVSEANDEEETEELDEEIQEEMKERVMDLPVKVDCLVQTEISGLGKRLSLESPGEQVVPSLAGFTPVENKSMELSLLARKVDEEVPVIEKPVFLDPLHNQRDKRRNHHGSHSEVGGIPEQRRSAPESFLFPGSFTIPLSFAVTNKPPSSEGDEFGSTKDFKERKLPEYPWEARNREIREKEELVKGKRAEEENKPEPPAHRTENKPEPPAHRMENRPKAKTPIEPEYRSVHKTPRPPPLPPHQHLDLYSEPRTFPDTFPPPPPPPMAASFAEQKPLPPTPHTPDRPLPPSPRLPTSASFPVPPVARHSPNIPHRPLPSPPNTLKTRSVDAGIGKGLREQLLAQQGCTLPPELSGATPRRHGLPAARKKHRAPAVPPHASLPETPVFSRGCDIPRAPYRALGIPLLRSSVSEEGAALCGPGRGWYPKQRRPAARSTENLEQSGWGSESGGGGGGRKPHTLPPNMSPPKFFHRSSPREALRRVTSLLIRGRAAPPAPETSTAAAAAASNAAPSETPRRQKRGFFRHFWKKSKHYSLEQ